MDSHAYNVALRWNEGRIGTLRSPELNMNIEVATPPEFDKGVAGIWSPEHLYTASVVSCFMTTFLAIADFSKLEFAQFECDAVGVLAKVDGKFQMTEVHLKPVLHIVKAQDAEKADRLLHKAEAACLISNSIKTAVKLSTTVHVVEPG